MQQNLTFEIFKNLLKIWGGAMSLPIPVSLWGGEHPVPTPHPIGALFLALAMIRPPLFEPWIRPWAQSLNQLI